MGIFKSITMAVGTRTLSKKHQILGQTIRLNAFTDIRPLKAQYRRQETQITHVPNHKDHPK